MKLLINLNVNLQVYLNLLATLLHFNGKHFTVLWVIMIRVL